MGKQMCKLSKKMKKGADVLCAGAIGAFLAVMLEKIDSAAICNGNAGCGAIIFLAVIFIIFLGFFAILRE